MKRKRESNPKYEKSVCDRKKNLIITRFTEYEKNQVFKSIAKYLHLLNFSSKSETTKSKGWLLVTEEFNTMCNKRTGNQIINYLSNFKSKLKRLLREFGLRETLTKLTPVEKEAICLFENDFFSNPMDGIVDKGKLKKIRDILLSIRSSLDTKNSITEIVVDESDSFYSLGDEEKPFDENPLQVETKNKTSMDEQISLQSRLVSGTSSFPEERSFINTQDNENSPASSVRDFIRKEIKQTASQSDTSDNLLCFEEEVCNDDSPISDSNVQNIDEEPTLPSIAKVQSLSTKNLSADNNSMVYLPQSAFINSFQINNSNNMVFLPQSSLTNSFQNNEDLIEEREENKINSHVSYPPNTFFLVRKTPSNPPSNPPSVDPAIRNETSADKLKSMKRKRNVGRPKAIRKRNVGRPKAIRQRNNPYNSEEMSNSNVNELDKKKLLDCIWIYKKGEINQSNPLTTIDTNNYESSSKILNNVKLEAKAWSTIAVEFNNVCKVQRKVLQIRNIWYHIKHKLKKNLTNYGVQGLCKLSAAEKLSLFLMDISIYRDVVDLAALREAMKGITSPYVSENHEKSHTNNLHETEDSLDYLFDEGEAYGENRKLLDEQIASQMIITNGLPNGLPNLIEEQNFSCNKDSENSQQITFSNCIKQELGNTGIHSDPLKVPHLLEENDSASARLNGNFATGLSAVHYINQRPPVNNVLSVTNDDEEEAIEEEEEEEAYQLPSIVRVQSLSTKNLSNKNKNDLISGSDSVNETVNETVKPFQNVKLINPNVNCKPNTYFILQNPSVNPFVNPTLGKETLGIKSQLFRQAKMQEANYNLQIHNLQMERNLMEDQHKMKMKILESYLELSMTKLNHFKSSI